MTPPACSPVAPSWMAGPIRPEFLRDEVLPSLFEASAAAHAGRAALRCDGAVTTYGELDLRAARFAGYLRDQGIGRHDRVVLWLPRGADMYAAMLGILKAGATYVPLDPEYPPDRVAYVVSDSGARSIVTGVEHVAAAARFGCRVLVYELERGKIDARPPLAAAERGSGPDDCAYIIYTSGSTGRPKGVMVSHRAICHFVHSEGSVLGLRSSDVVFQGSSLSFDMSLEEIWPAWAAGATLVVGTREMLRAGSDLAARLSREGVTAWTCVPTLLAMQEHRVPSLRLLNLGGEACPPELVRLWSRPGLRILNTYGPTETAITATYAEVEPGRPVTIGRPLPNYTAYVLPEPGTAALAADGSGELAIGGPGVALGYVGRPELTAERFIPNPYRAAGEGPDPLLYRTGDRARFTADGDIEFLGRIDTQVKVRGFRIELAEIESVLLSVPGVKQAVATVHQASGGEAALAGYVVLLPGANWDEAAARARLAERLPSYMVPDALELLPVLPMLTSGKVDRKSLPAPRRNARRARPLAPPITVTERRIHAACCVVVGGAEVSIDDDFFADLGGHSLRAAALVSALRKEAPLRHVSMADVYHFPTIRGLAAHLDATRPQKDARRTAFTPVARGRYLACAAGQALGLVLVYGLFSLQWLIPYLAYAWLYNTEGFERVSAIGISLCLFLLAIPVMLAVGILAKWVILGRLEPGEYPLWGATYYRWWLTQRLLDTVPIDYLSRSPLLAAYYRLLGARIGRGVLLDSVPIDAPDCVVIGDDSGFGAGASLSCCKVEDGKLKVGRIEIGQNCYIGVSSVVAMNTIIGDGAELADLSMLPAGRAIPAGEKWTGSPARSVGRVERSRPAVQARLRRWSLAATYVALLLVFPVFAVLPVFPGMMLMTELDQNTAAYGFVLLSPLLAIGFVLTTCVQIVVLKWLLVGRVKPARVPVASLAYLRHWLVDQLMRLSLDVVNPLYATLYLNPWYRLLGVKLGRRAEVSTASSIAYDLLTIGEESFIADAVSLGAPRIDGGELTIGPTDVGRRAFVGNSAVVPAGTTLGDGVLVGVLSVPPEDAADAQKKDSSWFGTPAVFLPQRQTTGFDEGSTFRPKRRLVCQRLVIEFVRVILPMTVLIALTSLLMSFVVDLDDAGWSVAALVAVFPLLYIGYAVVAAAIVVLVKWLVIGRYRPVEKPLWNAYVWRSELVTSTYENLAVPLFAEALRGTPFLPAYLRLLGSKIGRRVFLDTTDVTEFDLVRIGDDAALNRDCGPQTHLFEDRVMKISTVDIGARCVVGDGSIVLYDARMEDDSTLGELSMLMKGETLPAGTHWEGSPARPT